MSFVKAVKRDAKGRVALVGPAGSGKSFTMLKLARALAGQAGKIAAIDTEHGSLSKYAHTDTCGGAGACKDASHFDFDVNELASFTHDNFLRSLEDAEKCGYAVFCCDSISHFWMGKDGALEFVDTRAKRNNGDSFSGWKDFRPHERAMIDAIIASPVHVIVTMRTKNEYVTEKNDKGKMVRRKIGLAPVQREGIEYEFDLVGTLDDDNTLLIDKTRCPEYAGKALTKPGAKEFQPFIEWLKGAPNAQKGATENQQTKGPALQQTLAESAGPAQPAPIPPSQVNAQPSAWTVRAARQVNEPGAPLAVSTSTEARAQAAVLSGAIPPALRGMFDRLSKGGYGREALRVMKGKMAEAMPVMGSAEYERLVRSYNLESDNAKVSTVKKCLLEMWALIEFANANKPAERPAFQATDEDIPAGMFPEGTEKDPNYAEEVL